MRTFTVINRVYKFAAAHRLEGMGKCANVHGHNYVLCITVGADELTNLGVVLPFDDLDTAVSALIEQLDHHYLLANPNAIKAATAYPIPGTTMLVGANTVSTEELAQWIFGRLFTRLAELSKQMPDRCGAGLRLMRIVLEETDRNSAEVINVDWEG